MKATKFLAVALLAGTVFAENIAVLDSKQILTESTAYKKITTLVDTKYKAEKDKLEAQRNDYTKAMEQLTRDKLTQDKASFQAKEEQLTTQRTQLQQAQTAFTKKVMEDQNAQMKSLFKKFQTVVDTYAKKNKIDLVLNKFVVISTNNSKLDITKAIEEDFTKATS